MVSLVNLTANVCQLGAAPAVDIMSRCAKTSGKVCGVWSDKAFHQSNV